MLRKNWSGWKLLIARWKIIFPLKDGIVQDLLRISKILNMFTSFIAGMKNENIILFKYVFIYLISKPAPKPSLFISFFLSFFLSFSGIIVNSLINISFYPAFLSYIFLVSFKFTFPCILIHGVIKKRVTFIFIDLCNFRIRIFKKFITIIKSIINFFRGFC